MASFLIFSGFLTGFIQINLNNSTVSLNNGINNDIDKSSVFDLNKNLFLTKDLISDFSYNFEIKNDVKNNKQSINIKAFKLDEKTIIIKGFNEDVDNSLLKTIDLDIKNINPSSETYFGSDIIPVTVNVTVNDDFLELSDDNSEDIIEYDVVSGDSIGSIANKFSISVDTILWANDLNSKSSIKIGQKLVILPVSGISYKVKNGDTLSGLSARFNVTERDIISFNKTNGDKLIIGENIIIPGGKISNNVNTKNPTKLIKTDTGLKNKTQNNVNSMFRPINGVKTQGIHGNNGVDFGADIGTHVHTVMDGVVTLVRGGDAWNGGYGNYIVIKHDNGVQTLYAHLSSIAVNKGQNVDRAQFIGKSGNSGQSTGPHLHFEVRGTKNPF